MSLKMMNNFHLKMIFKKKRKKIYLNQIDNFILKLGANIKDNLKMIVKLIKLDLSLRNFLIN